MQKLPFSTLIRGGIIFPLLIPSLVVYFITSKKEIINSDIVRWGIYRKYIDKKHILRSFIRLMVIEPEFRTQFYMRVGTISHILRHILPGVSSCYLSPHVGDRIGEGFILMHAIGCVFNGSIRIGKNCTCLHGVTIGASETGVPTIGDNCYIGSHAQIIGGIVIGNNVKIGAGAIVVSDVPSNCTIVGYKARVVKCY